MQQQQPGAVPTSSGHGSGPPHEGGVDRANVPRRPPGPTAAPVNPNAPPGALAGPPAGPSAANVRMWANHPRMMPGAPESGRMMPGAQGPPHKQAGLPSLGQMPPMRPLGMDGQSAVQGNPQATGGALAAGSPKEGAMAWNQL